MTSTADELARRAGCAPSYLRAIEQGRAAPNLRALARLVLALDVPVDLLTPAERAYARTLVTEVEHVG